MVELWFFRIFRSPLRCKHAGNLIECLTVEKDALRWYEITKTVGRHWYHHTLTRPGIVFNTLQLCSSPEGESLGICFSLHFLLLTPAALNTNTMTHQEMPENSTHLKPQELPNHRCISITIECQCIIEWWWPKTSAHDILSDHQTHAYALAPSYPAAQPYNLFIIVVSEEVLEVSIRLLGVVHRRNEHTVKNGRLQFSNRSQRCPSHR